MKKKKKTKRKSVKGVGFAAKNKKRKDKVGTRGKSVGRGDKLVGVIRGGGKGYAFFVPDDKGDDLFVAARDLNGASHGDRVEVIKISQNRGNGEGAVVKILERGDGAVVGAYRNGKICAKEFGEVDVDAKRSDFLPENGTLVVAKLLRGVRGYKCRIVEVLGAEGELTTEIMGVIRSLRLAEHFSPDTLAEAEKIADSVLPSQLSGRRDFRGETVVTIDGESSKDFDDAISVTRTGGGYKLQVHIADVAQYVTEGSALDKEAFERGTSVYFADRVLPMLPEKLSNGICSLNEGEDRLTLSAVITYDAQGKAIGFEVTEGVIRSTARLTYGEVQRFFDGEENVKGGKAVADMLICAKELALLLIEARSKRGAVDFELGESEIIVDGERVVDVRRAQRLFSHRLIEEFMVATNEQIAREYCKKAIPFVYRAHDDPPQEKTETLVDFLDSLGVKFVREPRPTDYKKLPEELPEDIRAAVSRVALRSMLKADYRPECIGHFGLALEYYCHFTSPIRRYPDLAIHRIIKCSLHGGKTEKYRDFVESASAHSSACERKAEEAERRVDDVLKARFMSEHIGEEFDAVISGVTEFGVFAELDNGVEGLIKAEKLAARCSFNEKALALRCGTRLLRFGDKITVKVDSVSADKIAFSLVER